MLLLALMACPTPDCPDFQGAPLDSDAPVDDSGDTAPIGPLFLLFTASGIGGELQLYDLGAQAFTAASASASAGSLIRSGSDQIVAADALSGALEVWSADLSALGSEAGAGVPPQDLAACDDAIYVGSSDSESIHRVSTSDWGASSVDLSGLGLGPPELVDLVRVDDSVYAALQNLDDDGLPQGALLVELGCESGEIGNSWSIGDRPRVHPGATSDTLVVVDGDRVSLLDLSGTAAPVQILDASALLSASTDAITELAISPGGRGAMVVSGETEDALYCLDASGAPWTARLAESGPAVLNAVEVSDAAVLIAASGRDGLGTIGLRTVSDLSACAPPETLVPDVDALHVEAL